VTPPVPVDVSVVIPTNKIDHWLQLAIESVLSQEGVDLELVLLFDGIDTPDPSLWSSDPRVRVLRNEVSQGVGHALRTACAQARGRYIARLDADDVALPGRFATQKAYLDEHPGTVAVTGGARWIDEDGAVVGRFGHAPGEDARERLLRQNVLVQSAIMFRADTYRAVGGYSPMRQMEDYDLWLRLAALGSMTILAQDVVEYRVHPQQTSRGVHPRADYVRTVMRERGRLAQTLGLQPGLQFLRDRIFKTALYAMYYLPPNLIRVIRTVTAR
jgi:glycosyltransferase involved in cell wall biosynthesis